MILFLIEIFILGCTIAFLFREKISDFLLSFLAILLGLFGYFINVVFLALFNISISISILSILMGVEIILLFLSKWLISRRIFFKFRWTGLWYVVTGVFFIVASLIFIKAGYVYASPDSLYLIVMGRNILETGLSEWYFASPLQWGVFVPVLHIIAFLFGYEYAWFIQPVISLTFLIIFGFVVFRASRDITSKKVLPYLLPLLSIGLLISSNLYWIAQFYIHNNLNTAIIFFIIVASLYFAIRNQEYAWLGITAIFLILLGMTRSENVILASLVIVLTIATGKIPHRKMLWTFLPFLVFQIIWNLVIIRINPIAFSNLMNISQLKLVTIALGALIVFVIAVGNPWGKKHLVPLLNILLVVGVIILLGVVFLLNPSKIFLDTWDNLYNMFFSGKWLATFWAVVILLLLVKPKKKDGLTHFFNILIFSFFSMIVILGAVKAYGYHNLWYDSANRMYIHILPIMVFYLSIKISSQFALKGD